jgi:hypothetical protein
VATSVDSGFASWLKGGALWLTVLPANAAAWAGKGVESEIVTPYATRADALVAGAAQADILSGPNVRDAVEVLGARKDLLGKLITLKGDRLGYTSAGVYALVLGVEEQENGTTILTVLKRLS